MVREKGRTEDSNSSQTDGSRNRERCSFCRCKLESYHQVRYCWLNKVAEGPCGMEGLRTMCDVRPPVTDMEKRLWQGWEEGDGLSEVNIITSLVELLYYKVTSLSLSG